MENPKGLLIIAHHGLRKIPDQEIIAALPQAWLALDRPILHVGEILLLGEERNIYWDSYKQRQEQWFRDELLPALATYEGYEILYFGMTHIPLAMHLGFLFGERYKVLVFQCPREMHDWRWSDENAPPLPCEIGGMPHDRINGPTEAIIRIGTYVAISASETNPLLPQAAREIDIHLKAPHPSPFKSRAQLETVAAYFLEAVHALCDKFSDLKAIHVFAAVPPGLAFLLGKQVSPNKDSAVYIYHYKKEDSPRYKRALKLQPENVQIPILDQNQRNDAENLRFEIGRHFVDLLKPFSSKSTSHPGHWVPTCFTAEAAQFFDNPIWEGLDPIPTTGLKDYDVDTNGDFPDSDPFLVKGNWRFSDLLLYTLLRSIEERNEILMAMRLFVFHEALHFKTHHATSNTTKGIGQFPKVVETIDYQADVYALLHEIAFQFDKNVDSEEIDKNNYLHAIDLMLKTMWAFDQYGKPDQMQLRRLNRYLIWYFQYARIADETCNTADDILRILCVKPDIEMKGLDASFDPTGKRYMVSLIARDSSRLEIAALVQHRLRRYGYNEDSMNLQNLLAGFVAKDSTAIKQVLQTFVESTR